MDRARRNALKVASLVVRSWRPALCTGWHRQPQDRRKSHRSAVTSKPLEHIGQVQDGQARAGGMGRLDQRAFAAEDHPEHRPGQARDAERAERPVPGIGDDDPVGGPRSWSGNHL